LYRILVIGDAILDKYQYGIATRLSPEAPVPVVKITGEINQAGGACNVALNADALGVPAKIISIVGQDEAAKELVAAMHSQLSRFQFNEARIDTTVKTRFVVDNHHILRIESFVKDVDWVIFSDYGKHFQSRAQDIIEIAKSQKKPIAVDPKTSNWEIYRGADLITPNLSELKATGQEPEALIKAFDLKELLVTEGENGMTHYSARRKKPIHRDAKSREVIDVTGAGDTALAAFVCGKVRGWEAENCME
jgi:D-beta-D-heptose 7-phosphate kinase/D-beta-D-heptose 1-phosphate adenosyltransferase